MNQDVITKRFDEPWARDGARIVANAATAKQIAEFFFRQGVESGKEIAMRSRHSLDSIVSQDAARAL
jgi:hypothetical protein